MKTTITLSKADIEGLIRQHVEAKGFELEGNLDYQITAGYSDNRESWPASLNSITATVKPARTPSGPPANLIGVY